MEDEMTDREALEALLTRFHLTPYTGKTDRYPAAPGTDLNEVVLAAHEGGVEGYNGFHVRFAFDVDGNFQSLGIWE